MKNTFSSKKIFLHTRKQGISIRRRFSLCLIVCLISVIAVLFLLLNLFDKLNSSHNQLEHVLTQQLNYSTDRIYRDMDQLAACAADFSTELSDEVSSFALPFESLQNNSRALSDLQQIIYDTVLNNMHIANCSGAFLCWTQP